MSFATYSLKNRLGAVGTGSTEARYGELVAIIKQDHPEARGQVYAEIAAIRLAGLLGVDVASGALVSHDTGLKFASLKLSNQSSAARNISTNADLKRVLVRYPRQCARIAVFDLWIGNDDRAGNLIAGVGRGSSPLIVALDHGRALLGGGDHPLDAMRYLNRHDFPRFHPFGGGLDRQYCDETVAMIASLPFSSIYDACDLGDTCGAVMVDEQAELADVLDKRRQWLPALVASVLFPPQEPAST